MSILDEIARGGRTSALDVAMAGTRGRTDALSIQNTQQALRIKTMEMNAYIEQRVRDKRLRASLTGADFSDYTASTEAAKRASEAGEYETAMKISEHALKQKPKKTDAFGPMQDVYVKGSKIGVGQYDTEGKLFNFKTSKQMTGDGGLAKPTKARTPTKEQITRGTSMIETSSVFGAGEETVFGLDKNDNKTLGRLAASRGQKLVSDAKQLGETISDETGMSLAIQELEGMPDIIQEDLVGRSLKDPKSISFPSGISNVLQDYLGLSTEAMPSGVDNANFMNEYNALPSGAKYIDPKGIERVKK